jgi:hypothetical protein
LLAWCEEIATIDFFVDLYLQALDEISICFKTLLGAVSSWSKSVFRILKTRHSAA